MQEFSKITYYDLRLETLKGRLLPIVGRTEEMARLSRVISRKMNNNCLIVGPSGSGKTALVRGWAQSLAKTSQTQTLPIVELDSQSFEILNSANASLQKFKDALTSLPPCILFFDNFGQIIYNKPQALNALLSIIKPLLEGTQIKVVITLENKEFKWLEKEQANFLNFFEVLNIKTQTDSKQQEILQQALKKLDKHSAVKVEKNIFEQILALCNRFPTLGQIPLASINLLDEALALAKTQGATEVNEQQVSQIVSDKINIPLSQLQTSEKELLKTLEKDLSQRVIGQTQPLTQIASTIKRAKLGLKNQNRPLGSFLMLGPSGVGKTETAKMVAEKIFGNKDSFVRIDMSEFGEAHTVSRLIGAPAGYVGFSEGGGLTNAVKERPYSLILLDEIEKAHPKIFDIFLQILDDGRLTSGQGETIDFTQTIIMATSNLGVSQIIEGFQAEEDIFQESFFQEKLVPALSQNFRLEFINRFDNTLVFKPLTEEDLLKIAQLEIEKIEKRVAKHKIKFKIDPKILMEKIKTLADPRFGARPVKRFIETTCEDLISQKLLS